MAFRPFSTDDVSFSEIWVRIGLCRVSLLFTKHLLCRYFVSQAKCRAKGFTRRWSWEWDSLREVKERTEVSHRIEGHLTSEQRGQPVCPSENHRDLDVLSCSA